MGVPTAQDVRDWKNHFGSPTRKNYWVFAGSSDLHDNVSYNIIPGFQLIDKNFVLRYDSAGHNPKHDLWTELLPHVKNIIEE